MKSLKESILNSVDTALSINNPYKELYPLPTVKDFVKNTFTKSYSIKWQCPELIKPYLNDIATIKSGELNFGSVLESTGLCCYIDDFKCISVSLIDKNNYIVTQLDFIGDWVSNSIPETKKECIKFFKTILEDPDTCFKKIIAYIKKEKQKQVQYGISIADCITFDKLFK